MSQSVIASPVLALGLAAAIAFFFGLFAIEATVIHFVGASYDADTQCEMPF